MRGGLVEDHQGPGEQQPCDRQPLALAAGDRLVAAHRGCRGGPAGAGLGWRGGGRAVACPAQRAHPECQAFGGTLAAKVVICRPGDPEAAARSDLAGAASIGLHRASGVAKTSRHDRTGSLVLSASPAPVARVAQQHQVDDGLPPLAGPHASDDERGRAIEARMAARHGAPSIEDYRRAYASFGAEWPGDDAIRRRHPVAPDTRRDR